MLLRENCHNQRKWVDVILLVEAVGISSAAGSSVVYKVVVRRNYSKT